MQTQANMTRWPHTFLLQAPTRRSYPPPTRRVAARSASTQIGGCRRENQRRPPPVGASTRAAARGEHVEGQVPDVVSGGGILRAGVTQPDDEPRSVSRHTPIVPPAPRACPTGERPQRRGLAHVGTRPMRRRRAAPTWRRRPNWGGRSPPRGRRTCTSAASIPASGNAGRPGVRRSPRQRRGCGRTCPARGSPAA